MTKSLIIKYRNFILLSIGIILILLSLMLILYDRYALIKDEVFANISLKKYNELQAIGDSNIDNDIVIDNDQEVDINTDYIDDSSNEDNQDNSNENDNNNDNGNNSSAVTGRDYIGFLEISEINLKTGLVAKNSKYNDVDKNVEILQVADYPDVLNGNFILASHSGNSKISYFKNLYKLTLGDTALVYYKEYIYHYKIVDIYNVPKTGSLVVKRDPGKTVMTLITCTKDSKTEQTVYILELFSKTRNEV